MVVVDIQTRAEDMGAKGWLIGAILASTFVVQFFVSPMWGRWSDKIGRKQAFTLCTLISALSYLVYALAPNLIFLLIARILAGLGSANVAVAQASVVDDAGDENRSVLLGRISAFQTAGMLAGPVAGGFIGSLAGSNWVGYFGFGASLFGAAVVYFLAPMESKEKLKTEVTFGFKALAKSAPRLVPLVILAGVAWFSLSMLEGTFGRLLEHIWNLDGKRDFGILFSWEAVIGIIVQGFLLAWLVKKLNSRAMLILGYLAQGIGLALTPYAPNMFFLFVFGAAFAFGTSISNPTINGLISESVSDDRQGEVFGVVQSTRAIGFALGPILGGLLFDIKPHIPYLVAGLVCVAAALLVKGAVPQVNQKAANQAS